ncbi:MULTISPECIES: type I-C CRISPR-associated protein Cas8c/Csd1 [Bacteroides]|uniref:type I-C CRISPR-associated protein Cas8c/Csd1 n=1 Tax=Bacteroides TaxID=816 RepID=UPI00248D5389|nr:type I-C CRISPR-associated protein Cas8c/Csd1 [Bacteroides zoogleoformans]
MILKALYDYYDRCGNLPEFGMELKELSFLIVIDKDGRFVRLEDRRTDAKRAQMFLVPKSVGRSSAPRTNFLWDNPAYVLGISDSDFPYDQSKLSNAKIAEKEKAREKERTKNKKCHDTFLQLVKDLHQKFPDRYDISALHTFYQNERILEDMKADSLWTEFQKNLIKNISFLIEGETQILPEKKELLSNASADEQDAREGNCLISGKKGNIVETTTATPIPDSQATAKLVSFQVNSGYDSYGKQKGFNAPISAEAEFKYTTALNAMLSRDSRNKFLIGNRSFVFWASANDEVGLGAENSLFSLMGFADADDPNRNIENARKVLNSIYSGSLKTSLDDKFYILGLAPNSARIAVTYWSEQPLRQFAGMILRHFDDMEIIGNRKEKKPYIGLHSMLSAVTLGGKSSDATPNLPDAVAKSIFQGLPYPYTLFASCIRRIRSEQEIDIARAAILKAYLNRKTDKNKKIIAMLDKENTNQGYLCGRLFAVLDKIQSDANGIHSIKKRYMNAASTTPASVFATILNLSSHHSENLSEGSKVFYEKIKQEIVDKISSNGFPAHLDLQDQGRFFVGYYHQTQWFYTAKEEK